MLKRAYVRIKLRLTLLWRRLRFLGWARRSNVMTFVTTACDARAGERVVMNVNGAQWRARVLAVKPRDSQVEVTCRILKKVKA